MNTKKILVLALSGALFMGCLTGCGTAAASPGGNPPIGEAAPQTSDTPAQIAVANAESDGGAVKVSYEEVFKPYEQFGLIYDSGKKELQYQGKTVRWFEDYYTISDGIVRTGDGSFDPSGKLVGVKEFSEAEFAARDIEAIKNPPSNVALLTGYPPSEKELEERAKEYEAFGVTYDIKNDQWYFEGEKVRLFWDVLTSNGEELTSGRFNGAIRTLGSADGTVDIYTVRDFAHPDASGNGALIGVEKYSQAEFDEHTQREIQSSSGFCTVTQE